MTNANAAATAETQGLAPDEIEHYLENGYTGPFTLCRPEEMEEVKRRVLEEVLTSSSPFPIEPYQSRHLDSALIYNLCAHPAICARIASLYGPDLVIWRSQVFAKQPGDPDLGWHQDVAYFHVLEPQITISAWIAISDATLANGCVEFIPGSHRRQLTHYPEHRSLTSRIKRRMGQRVNYALRTKLSAKELSKSVPIEVKAGQFVLFNERVLHTSGPNTTDQPRVGVAARITVPMARCDHDRLFEGHRNIVIHGEDRLGFNRNAPAPTD